MRAIASACLIAAAVVLAPSAGSQTLPRLAVQGQPYSEGNITVHLHGVTGQPALLAWGLDPLDPPLATGKGEYHIGTLASVFGLGTIPAAGRIDVPLALPAFPPSAAGQHVVLQGYVPGQLSNPASLPLDPPYLLPVNAIVIDHPEPSFKANFGDKLAVGDFNADGVMDLAVGAWFETVDGIDYAGRVYVMWGPDFAAYTALQSPAPGFRKQFGNGLAVADFDADGVDDLVIGEGTGGDPPTPGVPGLLRVYRGSPAFSTRPALTITSAATGLGSYIFGRAIAAGDLDADGLPDLVVGTPSANVDGHDRAGAFEVFHGPAWGPPVVIQNPEPKPLDFFGFPVTMADVTGDGILDIVEASGRAKVGNVSQAGRIHIYDGPTLSLLATIDNPQPTANARFGEGLLAADLDGDGLAELVVADVKNNAYIVRNPLNAPTFEKRSKPPSPNPKPGATSFGYFIAATDANGDTLDDIVISDVFEGDVQGCGPMGGSGSLYVALAPYFSTFYRIPNPFGQCGESFSWSFIASDLTGIGIDELVNGNPTADAGNVFNAGRVVILLR